MKGLFKFGTALSIVALIVGGGCSNDDTPGSGAAKEKIESLAEQNPNGLNFAIEFDKEMNTSSPGGTEVASIVPDFLSPAPAYASIMLNRSLYFYDYAGLQLYRAVWVSRYILFVMIRTNIGAGEVRVALNPAGFMGGFQILGGTPILTQDSSFTWKNDGSIPYMKIKVKF